MRSPASFSRSRSSRRHSLPPPTAACTIRSRPKAAPSSEAVRASAHGRCRASSVSFRRPPSAPSRAPSSRAARPCRTASPTRSNPATAKPARLASPSESTQRRASSSSSRSARSGGTDTGRRAARAKTRFATARSTISRRGVNHKPRPGSRSSISGTTVPSGPITKRSSRARSRTSPEAMQRRCGDAAVCAAPFAAPSTTASAAACST